MHGFTSGNGPGRVASFNPVIIPSVCHKNEERSVLDRYVAFATGLPVSGPADEILIGVPADCRRRGGGIETRYGQMKQVRARTTGLSRGIRPPVFFASVFVYNMWVIERNRREVLDAGEGDLTLLVVAGELAKAAKRRLLVYGSPRAAAGPEPSPGPEQFRVLTIGMRHDRVDMSSGFNNYLNCKKTTV